MRNSLVLIAICLCFSYTNCLGQFVVSDFNANLPEPVSNNAVCIANVGGTDYLYSFSGIDSTKKYSGIHLRSYRLNLSTKVWDAIPSLPDTLGKIATGASVVNNKIYIMGGYHVYANGSEKSSNKVHIYNPETNTFEADGADIPVATDDHVQVVYKDSLIMLITGWSNTGNIRDVQIYNPATDTWQAGTSLPNTPVDYRSFGASGTIVGDTIYYFGGARSSGSFPIQDELRKGYINPQDPTDITWSIEATSLKCYRAASITLSDKAYWIGGSANTYNYNGIAYNGAGGVPPRNAVTFYEPTSGTLKDDLLFGETLPMDLRGIGAWDNNLLVAGGMLENQEVSDKVFLLALSAIGMTEEKTKAFSVFPNPSSGTFSITSKDGFNSVQIYTTTGKLLESHRATENNISLNLPAGMYVVELVGEGGTRQTQKLVVQ